MKKVINGLTPLFSVLCLLLLFSCAKEELQTNDAVEAIDLYEYKDLKEFPTELTMDNWRKFIWAPQERIAELSGHLLTKKSSMINLDDLSEMKLDNAEVVGKVSCQTYHSFGNNFSQNLGGIEISIQNCSTISLSDEGMLNWFLETSGECTGDVCFNDEWDYRDGITTIDLVLMSRHIVGIFPFHHANQYVAADVTKNGTIDVFDIVELQNLILYIIPEFPNHESMVFISLPQASDLQKELNDNGTINLVQLIATSNSYDPCQTNFLFDNVRTAVKIGDVNGSFCVE